MHFRLQSLNWKNPLRSDLLKVTQTWVLMSGRIFITLWDVLFGVDVSLIFDFSSSGCVDTVVWVWQAAAGSVGRTGSVTNGQGQYVTE